eukprot:NODE_694_length_1706_cov_14.322989_g684_i0.p1 GENE.NODE_694_length_1706_cov_14.322989_g684_i0~~NODE_694_length_1706_cov_14.322989_g684_i0.p1  ORF type:complete len:559 (-),score=118.31 NODE_694_length_1706_cov_14.322989_g684_i0:29-1651(-)
MALRLVAPLLAAVAAVPQWGDSYLVAGTFSLLPVGTPEVRFDNLTIYYDKALGGRQDYDSGIQSVIQNISAGETWTVAWNGDHMDCVANNGSGPTHLHALGASIGDDMTIQPGLPDLTEQGWILIQQEPCPGESGTVCDHWRAENVIFNVSNVYHMYVENSTRPVRFEFVGYDNMFGSHFDHYIFQYTSFTSGIHMPQQLLKPDLCTSSSRVLTPKGTYELHRALPSRAHSSFQQFVQTHMKDYRDRSQYDHRFLNFAANLGFINRHNKQEGGHTLEINHFGDTSAAERYAMLGHKPRKTSNAAKTFRADPTVTIPSSVDWRAKGVVSHVKDQGVCGSCWAFSAVGAIESAVLMKNPNSFISLSEQFVVDCSVNGGNLGCGGGDQSVAYDYLMQNAGVPATPDYSVGAYKMINMQCAANTIKGTTVGVKSYVNVTSGDIEAVKQALATVGPLAVSIDASHDSFAFYKSGVYYEPKCGNKPDDLDHAVMAVGYGTEDGQDYWIVKNSWSQYWGADGFVKMSMKDNNCGVATGALYPILPDN